MKRVRVCVSCRVTLRVSRHIGFVAYRSGENWCFEFWLIVGGLSVLRLFGGVHRGFDDFLALAYKQGRLDDLEERALFEEQDRLEECARSNP